MPTDKVPFIRYFLITGVITLTLSLGWLHFSGVVPIQDALKYILTTVNKSA